MRKYTLMDESAPHQIRLTLVHGSMAVAVSCTCLSKGNGGYEPIQELKTGEDPWPYYNRVEAHNNSKVPFVPPQRRNHGAEEAASDA